MVVLDRLAVATACTMVTVADRLTVSVQIVYRTVRLVHNMVAHRTMVPDHLRRNTMKLTSARRQKWRRKLSSEKIE